MYLCMWKIFCRGGGSASNIQVWRGTDIGNDDGDDDDDDNDDDAYVDDDNLVSASAWRRTRYWRLLIQGRTEQPARHTWDDDDDSRQIQSLCHITKMQNSEKLCLKWNDFQENLNSFSRCHRQQNHQSWTRISLKWSKKVLHTQGDDKNLDTRYSNQLLTN